MYHLNSKDAETVGVHVRSVDALATLQEEADARIIPLCVHKCKTAPKLPTLVLHAGFAFEGC